MSDLGFRRGQFRFGVGSTVFFLPMGVYCLRGQLRDLGVSRDVAFVG